MQKKNRIEKKLLIKKLKKMTVVTNLSKEHEELEDEVNHPGDVIDDDDDPDKLVWIHVDVCIIVQFYEMLSDNFQPDDMDENIQIRILLKVK